MASDTFRRCRRQTPWLAFLSMTVIVFCMLSSSCIIAFTNNTTVSSWPFQPTVLLAVLSSILNVASSIALCKGADVTWWRNAVNGTTLNRLHLIWARGGWFTFRGPVCDPLSGWDVNKVAWASIIVAVAAFVDGPLLQRATQTREQNVVSNQSLMMNLTPQLADGWAGTYYGTTWEQVDISYEGALAVHQWYREEPLNTQDQIGYSCPGTCEGNVAGVGISTECSTTTQTIDLDVTNSSNTVFDILLTPAQTNDSTPALNLTIFYVTMVDDNCQATLTVDTCLIRTGTMSYPAIIQNTNISLNTAKLQSMQVISTYTTTGDSDPPKPGAGAGALAPLGVAILSHFGATATFNKTSTSPSPTRGPYTLSLNGMMANQYVDIDPNSVGYPLSCRLHWNSPTTDMLNSVHDILFRAALAAGNSSTVQTFDVQRTAQDLVFKSDFRYLCGALATMSVALLALAPLLWGFWELGRDVSLSPIETAMAFGAPLLRDCGQDLEADDILKVAGNTRVRYQRAFTGLEVRKTMTRTLGEEGWYGSESSSLTLTDWRKPSV